MTSAASVAATMSRKGQTVTIAGTALNAFTGSASAVLLPLNPYRMAANSDIQIGDEQMLLSALAGKPPLGAIITLADGSTKYTLIACDPLHPAGTDLLYDCVVRGHA